MFLSHTNKPSKKEAFNLVMDLRRGRALTNYEIDSLLNFFAPARPRKAAETAEQWVARAAAKGKEPRAVLRYVHVMGGIAWASDGYRAHRAKTTLPDGVYCPVMLRQVVASDEVRRHSEMHSRLFENRPMIRFDSVDLKTKLLDGVQVTVVCGASINRQFFLDATNGAAQFDAWVDGDEIGGRSAFGEFVIMGIRRK